MFYLLQISSGFKKHRKTTRQLHWDTTQSKPAVISSRFKTSSWGVDLPRISIQNGAGE